ncbi:MAG: efflux RND transporter periplasmic adaptor subunit [Rhodoferax sp.]
MNTRNRLPVKPRTLALLTAALVGAIVLGLVAVRSSTAQPSAPAAPSAKPALTVALVRAQRDSLPVKLSANGSVAAWQEASVGTETGGLRVAELYASVGDSVKKGQVLARFAAESVAADVALARAALAEAQAHAAEAAANAERARAVQGTGALSAQQIDQYLTQAQTAQARVASAQAQLDAQALRLKQTQALAPDDGIISSRTASVGAVMGAGSELFKLIRQGRLEWRAEVTATELERIKVGTSVTLTSPTGAQVKGRVRSVAPTVDVATRNGLVYVDLLATLGSGKVALNPFKPGMYARGEFDLGSASALTLPQTAVVVRDGFRYVYRVEADQRVRQVKVQTGQVLGDRIAVLSGIQASDDVVASGGSFLSDGDRVRVVAGATASAGSAPKNSLTNQALAQSGTASAASK